MSLTKRFLEEVSEAMGHGGEITQQCEDVAQYVLEDVECAGMAMEDCKSSNPAFQKIVKQSIAFNAEFKKACETFEKDYKANPVRMRKIILENAEERLDNLRKLGAPQFLIESAVKVVDQYKKKFQQDSLEKTGDLHTIYGIKPVYKQGNTIRIPVNSAANWAKETLTEEDWKKVENATQDLSTGEETSLELSCGGAVLKIDEHPEGSDRGGYVPTLTFSNVEQYSLQNYKETIGGKVFLHYNDLGEWQ